MDFARRELEKYGWKDGDGLGKTGSGIVKPIKANLKYDNAGLGHNISDELINPWWQRVYDSAANNVQVTKSGDNVEVKTLGEVVEITTKKKKKTKNKALVENAYGNFEKRAALTCEGETSLMPQKEVIKETVAKKRTSGICDMTDEELFSACGGRTVHKGARHGLSMSAKLARLEQQEFCDDNTTENNKKRKKKRKHKE